MVKGFREEEVDEVRERNDLGEVVSDYVTLKKKGRYLWGVCPFHKEKTPSFKVDPALQLYHCFGCQQGGNVFTFVMQLEGLDFPEAVKMLADRAGYQLSYESRKQSGQSAVKLKAFEAHQKAAVFYHQLLLKGEAAADARDYLEGRGFGSGVIEDFKIGYAPRDWDKLFKHLNAAGWQARDVVDSGLAIRGEKGFYDRFRARVVFPILDLKGRPVAFGGRTITGDEPKYMNSPETPIYHKGSQLYGLFQAKAEIVKTREVLVVEGYTDVVALAQAGYRNVVGTLGTAFTEKQVDLLARYADRIYLVFDADTAGSAAVERSQNFMSEFQVPGYERIGDLTGKKSEVLVVVLPEGKDPADQVSEGGPESLRLLMRSAQALADFCIDQALGRYDLERTSEKVRAAEDALLIISKLPGLVAQEEYLKKLSDRLGASPGSLMQELKKVAKKKREGKGGVDAVPARPTTRSRAEREMLQFVLHQPERAELDELAEEHFADPVHRDLFSSWSSVSKKRSTGEFIRDLEGESLKLASELALSPPHVDEEDLEGYFKQLLTRLKEQALGRKIVSLRQELRRLEEEKDKERYDTVFRELVVLETERKHLRYNVS